MTILKNKKPEKAANPTMEARLNHKAEVDHWKKQAEEFAQLYNDLLAYTRSPSPD